MARLSLTDLIAELESSQEGSDRLDVEKALKLAGFDAEDFHSYRVWRRPSGVVRIVLRLDQQTLPASQVRYIAMEIRKELLA